MENILFIIIGFIIWIGSILISFELFGHGSILFGLIIGSIGFYGFYYLIIKANGNSTIEEDQRNYNPPHKQKNITYSQIPSIQHFDPEFEEYQFKKNYELLPGMKWYQTNKGIGSKTNDLFFTRDQLKFSGTGTTAGFWVTTNEINKQFLFNSSIEMIGIDSKSNKFVSKCPNCTQSCRGNIYDVVELSCPKCGTKWVLKLS